MEKLLNKLASDFPGIQFAEGQHCRWSPAENTVVYQNDLTAGNQVKVWALYHELAHAVLGHKDYAIDFELLLMEVDAWDKAKQLSQNYGHAIDDDHVQDCLDTYRDWLDLRSTCPDCANNCLQQSSGLYRCFNCQAVWQVSTSRFCRPYRQMDRLKVKTNK